MNSPIIQAIPIRMFDMVHSNVIIRDVEGIHDIKYG